MEDKTINIGDVTMHYRVSGGGKPLILMHGWGCNCTTVASIEATAAESHTVYNVDFPGFGYSTEPPEPWGVELYTQAIEQLAKTEGLENPSLLGHSFGGRVGILYASRNPVDKLILVDAAGVKPKRSMKYYYKVYTYKLGCRLLRLTLGKEKAQKRIDALRAKRGSSDYNGASPMMRRILSRVVNEDLKSEMPKIQAPTLLIWGENDTATPLADAKTMARLIPDAGLVTFAGCGHYSFLDNPRQFQAVLRSFLNS
ncbi:MAG: alpha/beta hydrolase [Bacteroidales bacterium]|nr:alpha/beta hydrolase [Bacteroidales bacterium]MCD8393708.1 alpha/beta hydrolase [Bacteroidales bacterium]